MNLLLTVDNCLFSVLRMCRAEFRRAVLPAPVSRKPGGLYVVPGGCRARPGVCCGCLPGVSVRSRYALGAVARPYPSSPYMAAVLSVVAVLCKNHFVYVSYVFHICFKNNMLCYDSKLDYSLEKTKSIANFF